MTGSPSFRRPAALLTAAGSARRVAHFVGSLVQGIAGLVEDLASGIFGVFDRVLGLLIELLLVDVDAGCILRVLDVENARRRQR